ncbi:SRPBCC family protein [Rhodococcus sp. NPDC058521]|uniref:SRPBCC family protein n=1 Tax=Rhodococcus sp. NPDC058521 TaxID=3346536 RepID=UPI00365B6D86
MTNETMNATITIDAPAHTVFGILADPTKHAAIDGTGWVRESLDGIHLTEENQVFRIAMFHGNHPDGAYEMANRVEVFDAPRAISWVPGQENGNGKIEYGGWTWRYDLEPNGAGSTVVTLTYDWSAVPSYIREEIQFPPFDPDHLHNSLEHLAALARPA